MNFSPSKAIWRCILMKLYEQHLFDGIGYQKLFHYNAWRVAILNYIDELDCDKITHFQAHLNTDEAFVLLEGEAIIFFLNEDQSIEAVSLQKNVVLNVKKGVYHNHTLSKDAKLLIIENEDTCDENSPHYELSLEQRAFIKKHKVG